MKFYTGSYSQDNSPAKNPKGEGIGLYSLNIETGEVVVNGFLRQQRNPSYLCVSADNKNLFAVEELPERNNALVY